MTKIDELKSTGLKASLPRLKILEIFQTGQQRHMTAEDVSRVLLEAGSDVALATVYRVLAQFEQAEVALQQRLGALRVLRQPGLDVWCAWLRPGRRVF